MTIPGFAVSISSDLSSAGESVGCACVSSAPVPATCGEAIEVPWMDWNTLPGLAVIAAGRSAAPARICAPGAAMSGLTRSGTAVCGPREENEAIMRSCVVRSTRPWVRAALAGPAAMLCLMRRPSAPRTCAVGTQCVSVAIVVVSLVL